MISTATARLYKQNYGGILCTEDDSRVALEDGVHERGVQSLGAKPVRDVPAAQTDGVAVRERFDVPSAGRGATEADSATRDHLWRPIDLCLR